MTKPPLIPALAADLAPETFAKAKRFAVDHVQPFAAAWDEVGAFPRSLFLEAGRQGLLGLRLPKDVGGQSQSWNATAAYVEALSYGESGGAVMGLLAQSELTLPLLEAQLKGEQRSDLVSAAVKGEKILALALSEPQAGSDLSMTTCIAKKSGDSYIVDGEKMWITNGGIADVLLLSARTGSETHDLSLFAVATASPGFEVLQTITKIGNLSANTAHLKLYGAGAEAVRRRCRPAHASRVRRLVLHLDKKSTYHRRRVRDRQIRHRKRRHAKADDSYCGGPE